jgi:5-methylcytosine-specific restriction protein B
VFQLKPRRGALIRGGAEAAAAHRDRFLLHIDEINRADLAKVLGEAIYLFEPNSPDRAVDLPFDFGEPVGRSLSLPKNLYVLGTMNSADRSIAILDVAVRRRFAFVPVWPDAQVLEEEGASARRTAASRAVLHFSRRLPRTRSAVDALATYFSTEERSRISCLRPSPRPLIQE